MSALLHLDDLGARYGPVTALHPLTLHITAGARHAVIGPNGAGKTTLLNLIAGTVTPNSGRIRLAGVDITRRPAAARARLGIGRTFQHPGVIDTLTVADNIAVATQAPTAWYRRRASRSAQHTSPLLDRVGLGDLHAVLAGQLPYGQRRLLEIAVALTAQPRLLLLDEPSAGLDPAEIRHLAAVIRELPAEITVILIDHHLDLVWQLADTVTVLDHGRHLATGTPQHIRTHQRVRDAYLSPTVEPGAAITDATQSASATTSTAEVTAPREPGLPKPVLLQVQNLRAGYAGAAVLHELNLHADAGEVHAVLGRNGAGKSTLMSSILGLLTPAAGTSITVAGIDLTGRRPDQIARHGVALVPQGRRLFAQLSAAEHLALAARAGTRTTSTAGEGTRWDTQRVLALLPALRTTLTRRPGQMSGGQQQMLALARALLTNPRVLLLDEPSEGLAPAVIELLTQAIELIAASGVAVLLAEQNLPFTLAAASRITVLQHGRTVMNTDPDDLGNPDRLRQLHDLLGASTASAQVALITTVSSAATPPPPTAPTPTHIRPATTESRSRHD